MYENKRCLAQVRFITGYTAMHVCKVQCSWHLLFGQKENVLLAEIHEKTINY